MLDDLLFCESDLIHRLRGFVRAIHQFPSHKETYLRLHTLARLAAKAYLRRRGEEACLVDRTDDDVQIGLRIKKKLFYNFLGVSDDSRYVAVCEQEAVVFGETKRGIPIMGVSYLVNRKTSVRKEIQYVNLSR